MPLIAYQSDAGLGDKRRAMITRAVEIIDEYARQGFDLTLRQLFYQFVSRDLLENTQRAYSRLGAAVSIGRRAGLIDWDRIVDRTRELEEVSHWVDPSSIVEVCAEQFRIDKWASQPRRIEVWIEKEALAGVFERVCTELDVPYFCCRGYTSDSEIWAAGHRRLRRYRKAGQDPLILHFGDHDPSGLDMTRDIEERLSLFAQGPIEVRRLALNMDQIEQYGPPPNPAKMTDSRFEAYAREHGDQSWELDALEPATLAALVSDEVESERNETLWSDAVTVEDEHRRLLALASGNWSDVADFLDGLR